MISKEDVHTFIIDTDTWKPGISFQEAKFIHEKCGQRVTSCIELPYTNAGIFCFGCKIGFNFGDWIFLLTIVEHRTVILYEKGKILRLVHKNAAPKTIQPIDSPPSIIRVEKENPSNKHNLWHIRMRHGCNPSPCVLADLNDDGTITCLLCRQIIDIENPDFFIAVFNASLHGITSEVETITGKIKVMPEERRK